MIQLYDKPECPFCWRVRLALSYLGLDYQIIDHLDPGNKDVWQALTLYSTVPVMRDGDLVLSQSGVMLEYLQDLAGGLLPDAPEQKGKARELMYYTDAFIGKASRDVIFEKRDNPQAGWNLDRIKQGEKAWCEAQSYLSDALGEQDYFVGSYSMVECALTARYALAQAYGLGIPEEFGNISRWFQHMKNLPNFAITAPPVVLNM